MMKNTTFKNLLTAVVCLFTGVSAQAQFFGSTTQYPTTDFSSTPISFELSVVAAALDTDAATLCAALVEYIETETPDPVLLYLNDVAWAEETTADNHGFWMNADGQPIAYGDESVWRIFPTIDAENNDFILNVGQMPHAMEAGQTNSAMLKLKFNDKEATFNISLSVIAKPEYDIPEPKTLLEKELNVVGSAEITVEQYPRTGYGYDVVSLQIGDAIAKLGLQSGEMLTDVLADILYCTEYNSGDVEEGGGLKKESLTNESSAGAPGFWLHAVMNEDGEMTNECCRTAYSSDINFFVEAFAYNAETGELTCNLGQMINNMSADDTYFVNCYLVYGDKAYKLTYNLKIKGLEGMNEVGKDEVAIEQYPTTTYEADSFDVDVETIATALGCEVGEFTMQVPVGDEQFAPGATAGNQGYWFNSEGYVTTWAGGSAAFFIEPHTANDFSVLKIGQYPNRMKSGDSASTNLYFVNGDNYYTLHVALTILNEEDKPDPNDFKNVGTRNIIFQQEPQGDYVWTEGIDIPTDFLYEKLGKDATWRVYGLAVPNEDGSEPNPKYIDNYTGEMPGFWLNKDGRNCGWGSDAIFGISAGGHENGKFNMIQYPNRCSIGDVLRTQLFFVNKKNCEMVTFNIEYQIVDSVKNIDLSSTNLFYMDCSENDFVNLFSCDSIAQKSLEAFGGSLSKEAFESRWGGENSTELTQYDADHIPLSQPVGTIQVIEDSGSKHLAWTIDYYTLMDLLCTGKVDPQTGLSTQAFSTYVKLEGTPSVWIHLTIPAGSVCFATGSIGTNKLTAYWYALNSIRSGSKEICANVTVPNTQNDDCAFEYDMLTAFDGGEVQVQIKNDGLFSMFSAMAMTSFRFTTPTTAKGNAEFNADANGRWTVVGASGKAYTLHVSGDGQAIETTDGTKIVQLSGEQNNIATYQSNAAALDILNYASHSQRGSRETFTAYVEMVTESCYSLLVADNSQFFNVRFLRPVDTLATSGVEITDEGEEQEINVMDLVSLTDWRGYSFTSANSITDGGGSIVYGTPHYINYYGVEITPDMDNAYTDVEGMVYNLLYTYAPITWNGSKLAGGTFTYKSDIAPSKDFHIYIPITISHKWGEVTITGIIKVNKGIYDFEDVTNKYLVNAGLDEDLTFQSDGTLKAAIMPDYSLGDRSWAYIAKDSTVYAKPKATSAQNRPDGRKLEAVNGFIGRVQGWEIETNQTFPKCEWVYFGTMPYDLANLAVPIADDGDTYLEVPVKPAEHNTNDNIGVLYLRAGWGGRAVYKQTVKLPYARYRLEYWTININPDATNGRNLTKVICNENEYNDEISVLSTEWTKHIIDFNANGETSIHLGFESTGGGLTNPFLCIDGIRLFKIGESEDNETHNNLFGIPSPTILTGKGTTLSINLSNEDTMIAFEFDLQLPDGITIAKDEDDDFIATLGSRASKHTLAVSDKGYGLYHFLGYSNTNKTISGSDGELLNITLSCVEDMEPGNYEAAIKNIIFSNADKQKVTLADYAFNLEVTDAVPGDVNNDGDINVMDVVEMVAYIMGNGSEGFVFGAADLDGDGTINVMDLVNLVEIIMAAEAPVATADGTDDRLRLHGLEEGTIAVSVSGEEAFVASEFIVEVTPGQRLEAVTTDKAHRTMLTQMDATHYKVMIWSATNAPFAHADGAMLLHVSGEGAVSVSQALFATEGREGILFAPTASHYTTGISTPMADEADASGIYRANGMKVERIKDAGRGIYIANGKKHVVK